MVTASLIGPCRDVYTRNRPRMAAYTVIVAARTPGLATTAKYTAIYAMTPSEAATIAVERAAIETDSSPSIWQVDWIEAA